jgi:hypothetical protein
MVVKAICKFSGGIFDVSFESFFNIFINFNTYLNFSVTGLSFKPHAFMTVEIRQSVAETRLRAGPPRTLGLIPSGGNSLI